MTAAKEKQMLAWSSQLVCAGGQSQSTGEAGFAIWMKGSIQMQPEAGLPLNMWFACDKTGLRRCTCFPLSFPSTPASCLVLTKTLSQLLSPEKLLGAGKPTHPKEKKTSPSSLKLQWEPCWWQGTSAWISTPSFFPRIPVMILVLVLVPSQCPDEPHDRLHLYYRMVWKKYPWGKEVGVFIFQGMREDNRRDIHPELLVHNSSVRDEYLFLTRNERYCKSEYFPVYTENSVYPLGTTMSMCAPRAEMRERWEKMAFYL